MRARCVQRALPPPACGQRRLLRTALLCASICCRLAVNIVGTAMVFNIIGLGLSDERDITVK